MVLHYTAQPSQFAAQFAVLDDVVFTMESFGLPAWDADDAKFAMPETRHAVEVYGVRIHNALAANSFRTKLEEGPRGSSLWASDSERTDIEWSKWREDIDIAAAAPTG